MWEFKDWPYFCGPTAILLMSEHQFQSHAHRGYTTQYEKGLFLLVLGELEIYPDQPATNIFIFGQQLARYFTCSLASLVILSYAIMFLRVAEFFHLGPELRKTAEKGQYPYQNKTLE